jgi:DNA-binding MarR family transcriptional regulator
MTKDRKPALEDSECNAAAVRMASRRLSSLYDDALGPSGLKTTQYTILAELDRQRKAPPTLQALADTLVMDRSGLGHNLRPLERDGLISLRGSDDDRRRRYVILTPAGSKKLNEARKLWRNAQDRFDLVFGEVNAGKLRKTLIAIARNENLAGSPTE